MVRQAYSGPDMPNALGPYSPAIRVGDLVFVSAQAGVDAATKQIPEGGFEAECRQAFSNVERVLNGADADLRDVVKVTILYTASQDLPIINSVYAEIFPFDPPARTAAIVGLAAGRRVAVDAIAVTSNSSRDNARHDDENPFDR
jgi:2-iminobutanoate/2-iminopropanoate deaminase